MKTNLTDDRVIGTRDTQFYEIVLAKVFGVSFGVLEAEAKRLGVCDRVDLHQQGRRIFNDLVRMARGEISSISVPRRLPYRGEYSDTP